MTDIQKRKIVTTIIAFQNIENDFNFRSLVIYGSWERNGPKKRDNRIYETQNNETICRTF